MNYCIFLFANFRKVFTNLNPIHFKCNFCNGGANDEQVGFCGICSDDNIKNNIENRKYTECCQKRNICFRYSSDVCKQYITRLSSEFSTSNESHVLKISIPNIAASAGLENKESAAFVEVVDIAAFADIEAFE